MKMSVKIISGDNARNLEKRVNEYLDSEPLIINPKFHYAITCEGYYDPNSHDGDITEIYSVLISWSVNS